MDDTAHEDRDWASVKQGPDPKKSLAELEAKAPVKRKKARPFAKIYLDTAARAFAVLNCPKAIVWVWLVHNAWLNQTETVRVSNTALAKLGVARETKRRALRELQAGGLIAIEQPSRKTPIVTLL
jgi:hypothetical protein